MMRVTAVTVTSNQIPRPGTPLAAVTTTGQTTVVTGPPLLNSPELQLRFLNPGDLPEVKRLCKEWFPIEYPDAWYTDITSNHKVSDANV